MTATTTMPIYERPMGESQSKFEGKMYAIKLFNKYQTKRNAPIFESLQCEDVEEDNLQNILDRFAIWLENFNMPKYADDNFEPSNCSIGKLIEYIQPDSKKKYLERIKAVLKHVFPHHPDWDKPNWWDEMMKRFLKEADRHKVNNNDDNDLSYRSIRSLYKDNDPRKVPMYRDVENFNKLQSIDLKHICLKVCNCVIF